MSNLASWIRRRDEKWFNPILATNPEIKIQNAARCPVALDQMDALLLTGGSDISQEFLRQPVPDPSILEEPDLSRDKCRCRQNALDHRLPIFAICKSMQLLNVARRHCDSTLPVTIYQHRNRDVQLLRNDASAAHCFEKVNSSHHQAIDLLADGCVVESWCVTDDVIEQFRLRDRPFGLAVQYHPERGSLYDPLFADFLGRISGK